MNGKHTAKTKSTPPPPRAATVAEQIEAAKKQSSQRTGHLFEHMLERWLPQRTEYEFEKVWRNKNIPQDILDELGWTDRKDSRGIDLIARYQSGGFAAIQAKCFDHQNKVEKRHLDSFFAGTGGSEVLRGRIVFTTSDWTNEVEKTGADKTPPVQLVNVLASDSWAEWRPDQPVATERKTLHRRQQQAINRCVQGLQSEDRGKLIAACGTGKTLMSLKIAERLVPAGRTVLFAAPSIALVTQARRAWLAEREPNTPMHTVVVCSRQDAGGEEEREGALLTVDTPITTCPIKIAAHVKQSLTADARVVVFSTYQSLERIVEAQSAHGLRPFDLAIADEAHRTAGMLYEETSENVSDDLFGGRPPNTKAFQLIHKNVRATKRLYQTATPRIYSERSVQSIVRRSRDKYQDREIRVVHMDSEEYGGEFDRMDFKDALELMPDRLCDYKIIILLSERRHGNGAITDEVEKASCEASSSTGARLAGLNLALHGAVQLIGDENGEITTTTQADLQAVIGFCNRRDTARWAAKSLDAPGVSEHAQQKAEQSGSIVPARDLRTHYVDGESSTPERDRALGALASAKEAGTRELVMNAQLLGEGIDIPALDGICFLDDRKSEIDIVQSVGRVMRRSPGKEYGYIVLPVEVDTDPQQELPLEDTLSRKDGPGRIIGQVLRALRAHDSRIGTDLTARLIIGGDPAGSGTGHSGGNKDTEPMIGSWADQLLKEGKFEHIAMALAQHSSGFRQASSEVANLIEGCVGAAASLFKEEGAEQILQHELGMIGQTAEKSASACTIAAVVLINACLVHQRITEVGVDTLPGVDPLQDVRVRNRMTVALAKTWQNILKTDYTPVFKPALAILTTLEQQYDDGMAKGARNGIRLLIDRAIEIAQRYADMGMDHAGELYQSVMGNSQSDGASFSLPQTGIVLSELALHALDRESPGPEPWREGTIVDPACGSGTLLLAALTAIKRRHGDSDGSLHRELVENHLYGMDINPQSVQLAGCQLTIGDPRVSYERMNLYTLPMGPAGQNQIATGSMEFLLETALERNREEQRELKLKTKEIRGKALDRQTNEAGLEALQGLREAQLVIMNPPYTIGKKQSRKFTPEIREDLKDRMKQIRDCVRDSLPEYAEAVSGLTLSPLFSVLACATLDRERSVLAKVMPFTACTSRAGLGERQMLAREFHIETIVTLHGNGSKDINWSSDTNLNESLLVARRGKDIHDTPSRFVNLVRRPGTSEESLELVDRIESGDIGDWGAITEWPRERMLAGRWGAAVWLSPEIADAYEDVCVSWNDTDRKKRLITADEAGYQPHETGRTLKGKSKWTWQDSPSKNAWGVCCGSGEKAQTTLNARQNGWVLPTNADKKAQSRMREKCGHLLVPHGQDNGSGRLIAIVSAQPTIGDKWTPITGMSLEEAKAQAVWLNSTLGRIAYMTEGERKLSWPLYGTEPIKRTPIVNPANKQALSILSTAFKATCHTQVPQYYDGHIAPRDTWDDAVSKALGIDRNTIRSLAELLSSEPKVKQGRK